MKTKTKTYDQFLHAVELHIRRHQEAYESSKQCFLKQAKTAPASAIATWGESIAIYEEAYVAVSYVKSCLDSFSPDERHPTRRALLTAIASEFRDYIVRESTGGSSTSDFSNALKRGRLNGRARALRCVESLLDHEALGE